jgi:hypothetical protein
MCSPEVWEHSQARALKCASLRKRMHLYKNLPYNKIGHTSPSFLLALPTTKAKDIIVFRFIIEYSSLRDFYRPAGIMIIGLYLYEDF